MRVVVTLIISILITPVIAGCFLLQTTPAPPTETIPEYDIQIEHGDTERVPVETSNPVLDNCGGGGDIVHTFSRGRSTTVIIELTYSVAIEAGLDAVVKAQLGTEFSVQEGETISASNDLTVTVIPGTSVRYEVQWYETWDTGSVVIPSLNLIIPYRIRRGYDADISSQNESCLDTPTIIPTVVTTSNSLTLTVTNAPPAATYTTTPDLISIASNRVTRNSDWSPHEQNFEDITMVLVPAGCFTIGQTSGEEDEINGNEICFDKPFWIDKFEVTNQLCSEQGGCSSNEGEYSGSSQPRDTIDWDEAFALCQRRGGSLPTEAEWEYAARGPSEYMYPWGNNADLVSEYVSHSGSDIANGSVSDVGSWVNDISWVGAMDMLGNLREWALSEYQPYPYISSDGRESVNNNQDTQRVLRGGAFNSSLEELYLSNRYSSQIGVPNYQIGFRCVIPVEP